MRPVNVWDYERLAEEKLDANAHAYFAGGAGDEVTLRDNVAAFEQRKLRPRVLVDVGQVSTATTVLGTEIALPVVIAPLAMQRLAHPDGEEATARAVASSPSGWASRCIASGAITTGSAISVPSTVVAVETWPTSTSTRGRSLRCSNAATLSRRVTSSPAPPAK